MLLIIFILVAGHWQFSNIEHINAFDNIDYCNDLAGAANDANTRAFCMEDAGEEA